MPTKRGGDADHDRVRLAQSAKIVRRLETVRIRHLPDEIITQVLEVIFTGPKHADLVRVHVEPDHAEARIKEGTQQRQTDVPQRDHTDQRAAVLDFSRQTHPIDSTGSWNNRPALVDTA